MTVLTGFTGAGVATLLNRISTEQHRQKYAFILDKFRKEIIENHFVVDAIQSDCSSIAVLI